MQKYAKSLVDSGYEAWIVTRRYSDVNNYTKGFCQKYGINNIIEEHNYLFEVAKYCGIGLNHIHFTNMNDKYHFFVKNSDFIWHLDDDYLECRDITHATKVKAICLTSGGWINKCNKLLKDEENI